MIALETCHASVEQEIEAEKPVLFHLSLTSYLGENVTDLVTEAQCIIKIIQSG
jgi:hypothetical protein